MDWNHIVDAFGMALLTWLGYEARQWRIFIMQHHGGAPDAPKQSTKT